MLGKGPVRNLRVYDADKPLDNWARAWLFMPIFMKVINDLIGGKKVKRQKERLLKGLYENQKRKVDVQVCILHSTSGPDVCFEGKQLLACC